MNLHRDEVTPISKETRQWSCPKDDTDCTRAEPCRSCLGRRNRRKGQKAQRALQRGMDIPMTKFRGANGNEENWVGPFRAEAKSGAYVQRIATIYLAAEAQSEVARAIGDNRPFVMLVKPEGWGESEGLFVCRVSKWQEVLNAAYQFQIGQP